MLDKRRHKGIYGLSGLQLQIELKKREIQPPLIFISGHGDTEMAVEAIQRGALNFSIKPVKKRKTFCDSSFSIRQECFLLTCARLNRDRWILVGERKGILKLVLQRLGTKVISERLNISKWTVQGHRWRIYQKLKVRSEEELREKLKEFKLFWLKISVISRSSYTPVLAHGEFRCFR